MTQEDHIKYWLESAQHDLELDEEQKFLLDKINDFNIQTRYPDYKLEFYKLCDEEFTLTYLEKIKEFYSWFSSLLK